MAKRGNSLSTGRNGFKACTLKEAALAKAYALHDNLTAAYREAGYSQIENQNGNHNNARQILARPHVWAEYEHWKSVFAARMDISDNRILAEMAAIGFVNPASVIGADGRMMNLEDMPESVARSIKKVTVKRRVISHNTSSPSEDITETEVLAEEMVQVEFHDKIKALTWVAEINGMKPQDAPPVIHVEVDVLGVDKPNEGKEE